MFKLFSLLFRRNFRSIAILFWVLLLSSAGFLVMRQLTENIERLVSEKTQPLFGGDIRVTFNGYLSGSLIEKVTPYLSWTTYSFGEKVEFSTTLLDQEEKTWLLKVIAYTGTYPQKGILKLEALSTTNQSGDYIAATSEVISRFASGGSLMLDNRALKLTDKIIDSSDLWFSFGQENNLLLVPKAYLSGSTLMSSGSRLSNTLFLSLPDIKERTRVTNELKQNPLLSDYRIRSYTERSEQNMDTTKNLTNYIELILVVAAIFSGIILRSAHMGLFADLSNTLRIVEILGLSRRRQVIIFILLYAAIIPSAFIISVFISYGIIMGIQSIPEAREFIFLSSPIGFSFQVLSILICMAFLPAWIEKFEYTNIALKYMPERIRTYLAPLTNHESIIDFLGILFIVWSIFEDIFMSLAIVIGGMGIFLLLAAVFSLIYRYALVLVHRYRYTRFALFDGIRALSRPLTPSIPITVSLVGMTVFFVIFGLFSLSFRDRLVQDTTNTANIYAINVLDKDREQLEKVLSGTTIYSIIRARIHSINNLPLSEHLKRKEPSGEFSREFNITTNDLGLPLIKGDPILGPGDLSVDADFAKRIWIDIGDKVEFNLSGKKIPLTVANIRKSVREGFGPFFYFSFQQEAFKNAPKTYFISAYSKDIESWKKLILTNSGPHVTFIDIESILKIVQDISSQVLSVIGLFFFTISIFFFFAIVALFGQMRAIDALKNRLYTLFGMVRKNVTWTLSVTRIAIFCISGSISLLVGIPLSHYIIGSSNFLTVNIYSIVLISFLMITIYIVLALFLRPKRESPHR